jgi:LysM repeat protein
MVTRISGWVVCLVLAAMLPLAGCNRGSDEAQPTAPPSPAAPAPAPSPSPSPENETYTVVSGDTLSEIAQRFDTTVEAIMQANDLDNPDVLGIDDKLIIPPPPPPSEEPAEPAEPASEAPS